MFWTCMLLWSFKTKVTSSIRSFHWTYRNNNFSFSHMFYYFINFILLIFNIIYTSHIALVFKFSKPEYNLFEKSHHLIMCALRVLPKNTPLPVAVGSGNYSAGNFPAHPAARWPTSGKPSERRAENSLFAIAAHLCRKSVGHVRPPSGLRVSCQWQLCGWLGGKHQSSGWPPAWGGGWVAVGWQ